MKPRSSGVAPLTLYALVGVALLLAETGRGAEAAELAGPIMNHPATGIDSAQEVEAILGKLRTTLSVAHIE